MYPVVTRRWAARPQHSSLSYQLSIWELQGWWSEVWEKEKCIWGVHTLTARSNADTLNLDFQAPSMGRNRSCLLHFKRSYPPSGVLWDRASELRGITHGGQAPYLSQEDSVCLRQQSPGWNLSQYSNAVSVQGPISHNRSKMYWGDSFQENILELSSHLFWVQIQKVAEKYVLEMQTPPRLPSSQHQVCIRHSITLCLYLWISA